MVNLNKLLGLYNQDRHQYVIVYSGVTKQLLLERTNIQMSPISCLGILLSLGPNQKYVVVETGKMIHLLLLMQYQNTTVDEKEYYASKYSFIFP